MPDLSVTPSSVGGQPADVVATRPVFVVGCARSGTTLLQQLLNRHPAVAIGPETHFVRRFLLRREQYADLTVPASFERLIDDVIAMPEFPGFEIDPAAFRDRCLHGPPTVGHVFHHLLAEFAAARRASVVGEKTPNHCLYMRQLERVFPAARFVVIVRDPRAVVASLREVQWSTGTLVDDARVWRRCAAAVQHLQPLRAPMHVVSYEHLLRATDQVTAELFAHLGLDPGQLDATSATPAPVGVDIDREPWKQRALGAIDPSRADAWRRELDSQQVRDIEAVTWFWMRRFGYEPATPLLSLAPRLLAETINAWWRRLVKAFRSVRRRAGSVRVLRSRATP